MYSEPIKRSPPVAIIMGKTFKVMVVGEPGVGKTSLVMRVLGMSSGSISSVCILVDCLWRVLITEVPSNDGDLAEGLQGPCYGDPRHTLRIRKSDKQDAISSSAIRTILERDYFVVSARTSQRDDVASSCLFDMVSEITLMEDTVSEALQNLTLAW